MIAPKTSCTQIKNSKISQKLENYINQENTASPLELPIFNNGKEVSRNITNSAILKEIKACSDCKKESFIIIKYLRKKTEKNQGVCKQHGLQLADTNLGWTSNETLLEGTN